MSTLEIIKAVDSLEPISTVVQRLSLDAKKSLGQNFIFDLNITRKIAQSLGSLKDYNVYEVGPGPGGLTRALIQSEAASITVIEQDERFIPALEELKEITPERMIIVHGDALERDIEELVNAPRVILANLPYNVATPLIIDWLKRGEAIHDMAVLVQKEVGQRLTAMPSDKHYGRLSVLTRWLSYSEMLFDLPPQVFHPAPKVTSSVVRLKPQPPEDYQALLPYLERVTAAGFGQRRKMVRKSMEQFDFDWDDLGISETKRAEKLTIEQFVLLAETVRAKEDS